MNFLGHCFICQNHPHLITGNLGGDFYKGKLSKFEHLPSHIQQGIKLHRFIDDFTDQSDHIKSAARIFQENGISKVSFIACDILLDHYLSKNWSNYSAYPYLDFIQLIYQQVDANLTHMEPDFQFLFNKMQEYRWLNTYPNEKGIDLILRQFSIRVGFENNLGMASSVYQSSKETIDIYFKSFLNDIKHESERFILDNGLNIS